MTLQLAVTKMMPSFVESHPEVSFSLMFDERHLYWPHLVAYTSPNRLFITSTAQTALREPHQLSKCNHQLLLSHTDPQNNRNLATLECTCYTRACILLCLVFQVKIIIIDSIAFHFRQDFQDMAQRTRVLAEMAQNLMHLAEDRDLAVRNRSGLQCFAHPYACSQPTGNSATTTKLHVK